MNESLEGRKLYIPEMDYGGSRALAASFRSTGIDAEVVPPSTPASLKKGFSCTSGDECFPQQITIGDFLNILDEGLTRPAEAAFFMPVATGPCRFGQYATLIRNILEENGYGDALVYSISSENGYSDVGGMPFIRRTWWGVIASDILRRALLRIRPYEKEEGKTDHIYRKGVEEVCKLVESADLTGKNLFNRLTSLLTEIRQSFAQIETHNAGLPLIGVVGEIFCRLNTFSNNNLIRRIEKLGAEVWLTGVSEWILYTNVGERTRLAEEGHRYSKKMLAAIIKDRVMKHDEHRLTRTFSNVFKGREDETNIQRLLKYSEPYLPSYGALGEMTVNVAGAIHFYHKGANGIIDISPFTCMNGIASEAVYPRVSRDHGGIPIRIFYFDGTESDLDRDLGIFLELARNYKKNIGVGETPRPLI